MSEWRCASCDCLMTMPKTLEDKLRETHNRFFCVFGHGNSYNKKTGIEDLQGKLMNEYAKNAQLETEITKLKKSFINRILPI